MFISVLVSDWTKVVSAETMAEERDVPLEPGDVLTLIWAPNITLSSEFPYVSPLFYTKQ